MTSNPIDTHESHNHLLLSLSETTSDVSPPTTSGPKIQNPKSEFIWDAAERQGKRVTVLNFPDSWPPKIRQGILIGGASLNVNATLYEGPYDRSMGYPVFRCPWDIKGSKSADQVLAEAGLLVRTSSGEVDYERSLAYPAPEGEGLVNVRPWLADTSEKAEERERNLQKALAALSSATDSKTGERIFSVVLPWEAAAPFGLHGGKQADIVAMKPALYGGIHGPCYPLTANGENTLTGIVVCRGPAIRRGFREHRPVFMEDIAPTLARLLGIEPPADSEGKVLHRMLESTERSSQQ